MEREPWGDGRFGGDGVRHVGCGGPRSVYKGAWIFGATMRLFVKLTWPLVVVLVSDSWRKGSNAPSFRRQVIDEERMRPGHLLGSVFFSSVQWHCWLNGVKDIWPMKHHAINLRWFCSGTSGKRKLRKTDWPTFIWNMAFKCDIVAYYTHTYITYIQSFNGLFSRTTWVGQYQKDKPFWIYWSRDDGVAVASARPYALCSRQITMPAPHHSSFYGPDALLATQPTVSKHWRQLLPIIQLHSI